MDGVKCQGFEGDFGETSNHQSEFFTVLYVTCLPLAVTDLLCEPRPVFTPHTLKAREQTRKRDLLAINGQTLTNVLRLQRNTKESLCFRKVPLVALYHDYTRMNEVT